MKKAALAADASAAGECFRLADAGRILPRRKKNPARSALVGPLALSQGETGPGCIIKVNLPAGGKQADGRLRGRRSSRRKNGICGRGRLLPNQSALHVDPYRPQLTVGLVGIGHKASASVRKPF